MRAGAGRGRKRAKDLLELELRAVVSHTMWVLGIKHGSSGREPSALNLSAISPAYLLKFQATELTLTVPVNDPDKFRPL